jgi:hypothetical protein
LGRRKKDNKKEEALELQKKDLKSTLQKQQGNIRELRK